MRATNVPKPLVVDSRVEKVALYAARYAATVNGT